jgi:hypothetical protein
MTCTASVSAGTARLFNSAALPTCPVSATAAASTRSLSAATAAVCFNLPPNNARPELDQESIQDIRDSHFPGGSKASDDKSLYHANVTDSGLQTILQAGLQDATPWILNSTNYYEKTFAYSGVGNRSITYGAGLPSTSIVLVVEKFAANGTVGIITMYPGDA